MELANQITTYILQTIMYIRWLFVEFVSWSATEKPNQRLEPYAISAAGCIYICNLPIICTVKQKIAGSFFRSHKNSNTALPQAHFRMVFTALYAYIRNMWLFVVVFYFFLKCVGGCFIFAPLILHRIQLLITELKLSCLHSNYSHLS